MTIVVKYFARLREQIGRSEDRLEAAGISTVADVWSQVCAGTKLPADVLSAVNREYTRADGAVRDGDEVAFFPPVTGG